MRSAFLILAGLCAVPFQQVTENFGPLSHWDGDYKIAEISGRLFKGDMNSGAGDVTDGKLIYYTEPMGPQKLSQRVTLWFRQGKVDAKGKKFDLRNGVDMAMDDGTRLRTEEVLVDGARQSMTCPKPVRLLQYSVTDDLPWRSVMNWPDPATEIRGDSLIIDNAARTFTLSPRALMRISGAPPGLVRQGGAPKSDTMLECDGSLVIHDLAGEIEGPYRIMKIAAQKNVRMDRHDPAGGIRLESQSALFFMAMGRLPQNRDTRLLLTTSMRNKIRVHDDRGTSAIAERLDWNHQEDILHLAGVPRVELVQAGQTLRSREVHIDRWTRKTSFVGDISASVRPPQVRPRTQDRFAQAAMGLGGIHPVGSRPEGLLTITSLHLELESVASGKAWTPGRLRAWEDVRVDGPWEESDIEARGDEFTWDVGEDRIQLSGSPRASLRRDQNLIEAPLILFEGRSMTIVKGPHLLKFSQVAPEGRMSAALDAAMGFGGVHGEVGVTRVQVIGEGDVEYDAAGRRIKLLDRSLIRTQDSTLQADVLHLSLSADGTGIEEAIGFGDVRLSGTNGAFILTGDKLIYRMAETRAWMYGLPHAVLQLESMGQVRGGVIRINTRAMEIEIDGRRGAGELYLNPRAK